MLSFNLMHKAFGGFEKVVRETFLPRLFFDRSKTLPPVVGAPSMLPLKIRSGPKNPMTSAAEKHTGSLYASCKLVGAVTGQKYF